MSDITPTPAPGTTSAPPSNLWHRLRREPLLHFLAIGTLIFALDAVMSTGRADNSTIVVSAAVQQEARTVFEASMKRPPTPQEMKVMLDRWVDNEILYREGVVLGLDRGDSGIRDRVIFKSLSVTQAGLVMPKLQEAGLRQWFEARKGKYNTPQRFDFLEAQVPGERTEPALKAFVNTLNTQGEGQTDASLSVFKDRPRDNLVLSYGQAFADALAAAKPGLWQVLPSSEGLRVVQLQVVKPGTTATFENIKEVLYKEWKDETSAQLSLAAIREMGKKYTVRLEAATP